MKILNFYDLVTKEKFNSSKYRKITKRTKRGLRYFAITISPSGNESWRVISKKEYNRI